MFLWLAEMSEVTKMIMIIHDCSYCSNEFQVLLIAVAVILIRITLCCCVIFSSCNIENVFTLCPCEGKYFPLLQ